MAVVLFMACLLTFIMIKIVPEFEKIFSEFDLELPSFTLLLVSFSQFMVNVMALPVAVAFVALLLAAVVIGICYLCDEPPLKFISDRLFRGRHVAHILRIIALAAEHREPLADVLNRLAKVYPSGVLRRQLSRAAVHVAGGADWRDALRNTRLISDAEQGLLDTAERVGNLPWALREIATRREKLVVYRFANRLQIIYPLIILLLGLFVGFYAISLFIPLVKLIAGLSS
jgi:protein transport protein HofC